MILYTIAQPQSSEGGHSISAARASLLRTFGHTVRLGSYYPSQPNFWFTKYGYSAPGNQISDEWGRRDDSLEENKVPMDRAISVAIPRSLRQARSVKADGP